MQWFLVLVSIGFIPWFVHPFIRAITADSLVYVGIAVWNVGNWIGESVANTITLMCLYGAILVIEEGSKVRGKAARQRFIQRLIVWALYVAGTLAGGVLVFRGLMTVAEPTFALPSAVMFVIVVGTIISLRESPEFEYDRIISGMRLGGKRKLGRKSWNLLTWGQDLVSPVEETWHFLTLGNIGSGKSTFMMMNLCIAAARIGIQPDYRGVFYDPKNNLVPVLQKIGTPCYILNPFDKRSVGWAIHEDIRNVAQATQLAYILVPDNTTSEGQHWLESARLIIIGVVKVLMDRYDQTNQPWELRDIINAVESTETLATILVQIPGNQGLLEYFKPGTSDRNDHITTLQTNLQRFAVIASLQHATQEKISLKKFLQNEAVLHLGSDNEQSQVLIIWYGLIVQLLTDLQTSLGESETRRCFWFFDEATDGARYFGKSLIRLLTLGRGYGCSVHLFIQNHAAMVEKFGKEEATQIAGLCRHKSIVGGVDFDTANWFAKDIIGESLQAVPTITEVKKAPIEAVQGSRDRTEKGITTTATPRLTILPQQLMDHAFPRTNPKNGLTGLFLGGNSGMHFHTYRTHLTS
jgi:Type IV secretion-system coupling protein DNA-binding domain